MENSVKRLSVLMLIAASIVASCSPQSAPCVPATTATQPLIGPEAQAVSGDQLETWALFFTTPDMPDMPPGGEIRIGESKQIKIVWRVTGSGSFTIDAVGPDGTTIEPDWGPEIHAGSSWQRPGEEWGTGWTFPSLGCWRFQVQRGDSSATLDVEVVSA